VLLLLGSGIMALVFSKDVAGNLYVDPEVNCLFMLNGIEIGCYEKSILTFNKK